MAKDQVMRFDYFVLHCDIAECTHTHSNFVLKNLLYDTCPTTCDDQIFFLSPYLGGRIFGKRYVIEYI